LFSCNEDEEKGEVLASVYLNELMLSSIPDGLDDKEKKEFVDDWINTQIYLEAFKQAKIDTSEIIKRVKAYENSLKVYKLEELLVAERLDTIIKAKEINEFYQNHKADFELKDYLVRVMYLKVPSEAPDLGKIEQMYLLKNPKDTAMMQDYAKLYAANFYFDHETWVYFDDILKEVPLQDFNKEQFIVRKTKRNFEENGFMYFLNIYDYRLKDALSPLEFETENIKQRILNQRKKKLRIVIKRELLEKAYAENKIHTNI
jgi:hypothetical protein